MGKDAITVLDDETIRFDAGPERFTSNLSAAVSNATPSAGKSETVVAMARVELMLWALNAQLYRFTENVMAGQAAQLDRTKDLTPESILAKLIPMMPELMRMAAGGAPDLTGKSVEPANGSGTPRVGA